MKVKPHDKIPGVFWIFDGKKALATKNLVPGYRSYDEIVRKYKGDEYRIWSPKRSKLSAALMKGLKNFPFKRGRRVLYLGIASGTTASHISDILGEDGIIYGIEIAHRVIRELLPVADVRKNIVPIMDNARRPENYSWLIEEVDVVYEDVAQPDQARILINNMDLYLRKGGYGLIAVKASSIDVTMPPKKVYSMVEREVVSTGRYRLVERVNLAPYDPKHALIVFKKIV